MTLKFDGDFHLPQVFWSRGGSRLQRGGTCCFGRECGYSGWKLNKLLQVLSSSCQVVEGMHFKLSLQSIKPRISKELFTVYERFQASNASKKV